MNPGTPVNPTVRWRFVVDYGYGWTWWKVDGEVIYVDDPRVTRNADRLEEKVLRIVRKK